MIRNRFEMCVRDERGAAMVELALVLPLLIMLVMGIISFGRAYNSKVELTGAVREGARALALGKTTTDAETIVRNAAPSVGTITFSNEATCTAGSTTDATITASVDMSYSIPFVSEGTWTLSQTGVMRCGL
jgi:Flp pilus assembly protein TadG